MTARRIALPALATAALLVAGCGSSGDDSNRAESYSGLISKANAICTDINAKSEEASKTQDYDAAIKATADGLKKLKALTPPDKLKDAYGAFIAAAEEGQPVAEKLVAAIKAKDDAAAQSLNAEVEANTTKVNELANAAGLNVCGQES